MNKTVGWIISLAIFAILVTIILILTLTPRNYIENPKYSCNSNSDCVSQCKNGCVNENWAYLNPDPSECFRAWDCSCVNNQCYKDGNPQI